MLWGGKRSYDAIVIDHTALTEDRVRYLDATRNWVIAAARGVAG